MKVMRTSISPTAYRQELKGKILEVSMNEFKSKGVYSVRMDDIAQKLSISKRTLYEIYANKQELLLECIKMVEDRREEDLSSFASDKSRGAIDIIMEFYRVQIKDLANVNPVFYEDVKKFKVVRDYLRERHLQHQQRGVMFLTKGMEDGYFREDVDFELISRLAEKLSEFVMESRLYNQYGLEHVFRNIILLFFRGLCTPKGIKVMDQLLTKE